MLIPKWKSFYVIECLDSMCASIGSMDIRYELLLLMVLKQKQKSMFAFEFQRKEINYMENISTSNRIYLDIGYCYLVNFCIIYKHFFSSFFPPILINQTLNLLHLLRTSRDTGHSTTLQMLQWNQSLLVASINNNNNYTLCTRWTTTKMNKLQKQRNRHFYNSQSMPW